MDLVNRTPYPALLTRFGASPDSMGSSLVARVTYAIDGGTLVPAAEQSWIVSPKPWECAYGPMEADEVFYKGGTDVFVFGSVRAPKRRPVTQLQVSVEVGRFRRDAIVFGERAWLPRRDSVVASAPQPFVEMPLTMANAYGGKALWDELEVPCSDNPDGKGFIVELEQAPGTRLPNIEDPRALIARWDDRPTPVGLGICPPSFRGRLEAGIVFGKSGGMKEVRPRLFNASFPEMVAEGVGVGDLVRLTGVDHDGPITFTVPPVPVQFRLSLDRQVTTRSPSIDQIGVEVDKRQVFITYRYPFRYVLYQGQRRTAELLMTKGS